MNSTKVEKTATSIPTGTQSTDMERQILEQVKNAIGQLGVPLLVERSLLNLRDDDALKKYVQDLVAQGVQAAGLPTENTPKVVYRFSSTRKAGGLLGIGKKAASLDHAQSTVLKQEAEKLGVKLLIDNPQSIFCGQMVGQEQQIQALITQLQKVGVANVLEIVSASFAYSPATLKPVNKLTTAELAREFDAITPPGTKYYRYKGQDAMSAEAFLTVNVEHISEPVMWVPGKGLIQFDGHIYSDRANYMRNEVTQARIRLGLPT